MGAMTWGVLCPWQGLKAASHARRLGDEPGRNGGWPAGLGDVLGARLGGQVSGRSGQVLRQQRCAAPEQAAAGQQWRRLGRDQVLSLSRAFIIS